MHAGQVGHDTDAMGSAGAGQDGRRAVQARAVEVTSADPSTVSTVRFAVASGSPAPSRPTMAPPARPRPGGASMPPIARARRTHERTQHWPEHGARTNAPCHTPSAAPPGLATRRHRKPAPVGSYAEHEDENRNANRDHGAAWHVDVACVTSATWVAVVRVRVTACSDHERARALTGVPSPGPRTPVPRLTASRPPFILAILRPVAACPPARSPFPELPILLLLPVVVCVIAKPATNDKSVTHTTTFTSLVNPGSIRPNADVVAISSTYRKRPTPAFAWKPLGTADSISSMKAIRSAALDEAVECAVAVQSDVSEDIVSAEAVRDGVAHFYDDLSGSSSSRA